MTDGITRSETRPRYWEYGGEPTLLLGASKEDDLFQIADVEDHLDRLAGAGGNYVRCTMSAREEFAVQPFARVDGDGDGSESGDGENATYDLETWNPEYWERFESFLDETAARDVVVQVELWAFHDVVPPENWAVSPWNPANTVTYDAGEVSLSPEEPGDYHGGDLHGFLLTVPGAGDDPVVRAHQERFVDRVLESTFEHDHVLYCATNEVFSQFPVEWSRHWVDYVHERAADAGVDVAATEMFQEGDLTHDQHREAYDDPERYDFFEASQNATQSGDRHWENLQYARERVAGAGETPARPINHVKTYGGQTVWTDGPERGYRRFWRSLVGGAASVRLHRPPAGVGLSDRARRHVRSARMLAEAVDLTRAEPDAEHAGLDRRGPDEAYLTRVPGEQYAVYFPDGGSVALDCEADGDLTRRWLHVEGGEWYGEETVAPGTVGLSTPHGGHWVAVLEA